MLGIDGTGATSGNTSMGTSKHISLSCLFCHHPSHDEEANTSHMFRAHGFLVPQQERLAIDLETLLEYLTTVIEDYAQCIHCFTQRASVEAARQHMLAKGHCVIDLERNWSEYADFYDFGRSSGEEDGAEGTEGSGRRTGAALVRLDYDCVRLPSAKVVGHRNAAERSIRSPDHRRDGTASTTTTTAPAVQSRSPSSPASPNDPPPSTDLATSLSTPPPPTRHNLTLSHLREADRAALAHLPSSQQRAILAAQRQQASSVQRTQQALHAGLGGKGNKTLMKNFKPRIAKRLCGQNHMSLKA